MNELLLDRPGWKNWVVSDSLIGLPDEDVLISMEEVGETPKSLKTPTSEARSISEIGPSEKEWINHTLEKLGTLSQFPGNWDSYGGLPLDPVVRNKAVIYLGWLEQENLPTPDVFLGSGGTVQFEWQFQGKELELEIQKSGSLLWLKVFPNEEMEEGEIERPNAPQLRQLTHWLTRE